MITLDDALDAVNQLPAEQREMLATILRQRQIEERRTKIAADAEAAVAAFRRGDLQPETAQDLISRLRTVIE